MFVWAAEELVGAVAWLGAEAILSDGREEPASGICGAKDEGLERPFGGFGKESNSR